MQLKNLSKNRFNKSNGLLSVTKPKEQLSLQKSAKNDSKLLLKTKQILKVYIEE